jgi:hypothetical protein
VTIPREVLRIRQIAHPTLDVDRNSPARKDYREREGGTKTNTWEGRDYRVELES